MQPREHSLQVNTLIDEERPLIEVSWPQGGQVLQLEVHQAERLALELLRACRAAETDAFLMTWMLDSGYFKPDDALSLLDHFREWRLERIEHHTGHR